jgi:hypothetical protein
MNVETNEQTKQWTNTYSINKLREFKQMLATRKLMATVFWDRKGVLMVEFMKQGTTITSEVYCKTLKRLCRVIQNKRRRMLALMHCSCMIMLVCIQLLKLKQCWSISTWSCLTNPLTALISF